MAVEKKIPKSRRVRSSKKPRGAAPSVVLPTEPREPSDELLDYTWLVYGSKKIGKSSLFAQADDVVFLSTEPGLKALRVFEAPVRRWQDFLDYLEQLEGDDHTFTLAVLDTVDLLYDFCLKATCKANGIDHPADEDYGKGWSLVKDAFTTGIVRLTARMGVAMISHENDRTLKRRSGQEQSMIVPTMPNQARNIIEPLVDVIGRYCYGDDGQRVLQVWGDDMVTAGSRIDRHFQKTNEGLIPMGNSPAEAWQNFVRAFGNESVKGGSEKPTRKKKLIKRR